MIDGYEAYKADCVCHVYVSREVRDFLEEEEVNDRQHVKQIIRILDRLAEFGVSSMRNTEQFRHEDKFASGLANGKEVSVFAVKAHQLRVYGGFVRVDGKTVFACVEGVRKRRDKADQEQLKRVARRLGECGDAV